ncbi:MAG: hypothetical protein HYR90_02130 [Candidatus Andersenbacteria bacterium]|nr:hypothetical protein [Candidatus Andersenbacteria bacterium]MBI3250959.1 hypothetical protein [Candidatus Andersenbacteria bacterium]
MKTPSKKLKTKLRHRHFGVAVKERVQTLFLHRYRLLQYTVLVVGALASAAVAASLLLREGELSESNREAPVRLNVDVADELELAIENRQTAYENPPGVSPNIFE